MTASDATAFPAAARRVAGGADPHVEAAALVTAMTGAERRWCLDGDLPFWAGLGDLGEGGYHRRPFPAARVDRLGIPGFAFADGPRGVVVGPATAFPVSMARGATWDIDLEERIGEAIGRELRAVGASLYGGVCVNLLRHPAWGRAQETYGEDPHHVGELGAALTRGVQRHAMACVKHFAANSMENARFTVDVAVDDVALHEVYLPHFRRIVEEGVASVMTAYNAVNGEWCGQSRALIAEVLRDAWGFDGFVISDWIFGLRDAGPSVAAGLDVEMPYRMIRADGLDEALAVGECDEADVDAAVTRTLSTLLRFAEVLAAPAPGPEVLASVGHRALAREAATKAIVLLRNEPQRAGTRDRDEAGEPIPADRVPVLPLDVASLSRLAVVGPLAGVRNLGDGGSSDVWAPTAVTPLEGLVEAVGEGPGRGVTEVVTAPPDDHHAAAAAAAGADLAIVVVGYTKEDEGEFIGGDGTAHLLDLMPGADDPELAAAFAAVLAADPDPRPNPSAGDQLGFSTGGDRASLRLPDAHVAVIRAVAAANPRTVVAIIAGSAVLIDEWVHDVAAVVQCWYPGMEGGHALADVLLGRAEPSGRLPFTVPMSEDHLPPFDRDAATATYDAWHGYWRLARDGHAAAFPFGFGLSYTDLAITGATAAVAGFELVVQATAVNRGRRPGVEVVQVYVGSSGGPSKLVGFARVELAAGEARAVEVRVSIERLARRDPTARAWIPATGPHEVVVARHAEDPDGLRLAVDLG